MKCSLYILLLVSLLTGIVSATPAAPTADDDSVIDEYKIKVAFLYNFFNFIEWPKDKMNDPEAPFVIGLVGAASDDNFVKAFDPLTKKQVKSHTILIKKFNDLGPLFRSQKDDPASRDALIRSMKKCHVIMFCERDGHQIENLPLIIKTLEGASVLMVGERPGFIESGGHINFLIEKNKIRFEINLMTAKEDQLSIRAKLLKLARRVVKDD